jgi:hypothetical protein
MNHFALALLLPAAVLAWRWSRLVSVALWLTLATWLAYRGIKWHSPDAWAAGRIEWMRGVSMVTGLVGAVELAQRAAVRRLLAESPFEAFYIAREEFGHDVSTWEACKVAREAFAVGRPDVLAALLVASMGVDLTAWLIHHGAGQWGPQPFFQCIVLVAMCVVAWPRRRS